MTAAVFSSATPEWRTPPEIIGLAEAILGRIDLDPCSNDGLPNVPARAHFTRADDGLSKPWHGRVYLNPPYGRAVARWIAKAEIEVHRGNAEEVLALVAARPDTLWFRPLFQYPIAFLHGRVKFIDATGRRQGSPAFPSALALIRRTATEDALSRFAAGIGSRGAVMTQWGKR